MAPHVLVGGSSTTPQKFWREREEEWVLGEGS